MCLTFSIASIRNTPHSNMNSTRYYHKCTQVFMSSVRYSSQIFIEVEFSRRSQWPRGLRRRSAAAHLLRLLVRIPPGTWMPVCCECCVLLGRVLCDELIPRPEESYRLWCVVVCDLETSWMRRPWPTWGLLRPYHQKKILYRFPNSGSRVVPCRRTDGRRDTWRSNSRCSQFCERV
jgi:hypothetical protein